VEFHGESRFVFLAFARHGKETARDFEEAMVVLAEVALGPAARMGITCWTTRVFSQTGFRVDGVILPVAIAAHDDCILQAREKCTDIIPLGFEIDIRVIVVFVFYAIRSDDRSRADQYSKRCSGFRHRFFQPLLLVDPPDRLEGTVFGGIGAPEIASFDHPDLQVLAAANRTIGFVTHRDLFPKHAETLFECERALETRFQTGPAVICPSVVIIFDEIAGDLFVKANV